MNPLSIRHLHLPKPMMGHDGALFLLVSKGFSPGDRPSETAKTAKTGL
jgi:hypothetical protein